ncbi:MAG: hypothetical protein HZY79_08140 [Rhodoblastus sp.]|nr:MAG: hypothetical protein HZY79_08140 [Rhodoblastus sp.]
MGAKCRALSDAKSLCRRLGLRLLLVGSRDDVEPALDPRPLARARTRAAPARCCASFTAASATPTRAAPRPAARP